MATYGGGLAPGQAVECPSEGAAIRRAEAMSRHEAHAGAIAFSRRGVSFGLVRGSGVASSANDRDVVSLLDRSCWLPDPVRGAPPRNFNFGGMSGGIMLTVIQGALRSWSLSGIVYDGPCTSNVEGEAIDGLEILRARRACFLKPDGQLDVALWHGLGGHNHVEP